MLMLMASSSRGDDKLPNKQREPDVVPNEHHDQSPPLREIPPTPRPRQRRHEVPNKPIPLPRR
jgi:hypothetical protein